MTHFKRPKSSTGCGQCREALGKGPTPSGGSGMPQEGSFFFGKMAPKKGTPIFDTSQLWLEGSKCKTLCGHHQASGMEISVGGKLLCLQPFLTAQWAKPRAYRQFFCTFQPFQVHISGQEGRNDTLSKAKIIYWMWPMRGSFGEGSNSIRRVRNASGRIIFLAKLRAGGKFSR